MTEERKHYGTFSYGETPKETIIQAVTEGGGQYLMSLVIGSTDCETITQAVNQGIDSYLEGFTESVFGQGLWGDMSRLDCFIVPNEMPILLRRLFEMDEAGDENAGNLRVGILEVMGIEEV